MMNKIKATASLFLLSLRRFSSLSKGWPQAGQLEALVLIG
jgi:hypothetical protein